MLISSLNIYRLDLTSLLIRITKSAKYGIVYRLPEYSNDQMIVFISLFVNIKILILLNYQKNYKPKMISFEN